MFEIFAPALYVPDSKGSVIIDAHGVMARQEVHHSARDTDHS
ncbi:MAG: hypothetical protein Q7V56_08740 [Gammaproteobacteria bacterium]|nr:hypothetical protein [Gammaproteobacteria bacterium]